MRLPACALTLIAAFLLIPAAAALASINVVKVEITGSGTGHGEVVGGYGLGGVVGVKEIDCEGPPSTPVAPYSCEASLVSTLEKTVLSATPGPGSDFAGWSATSGSATACNGSTALVCEFSPEEATTVIAEFEVAPPAPTVTIETPTNVGAHEATLHGKVDPEGSETNWRFEYRRVGASTWLKAPVAGGDAGSGGTAQPVQTTVEGLEPHTEYEVRLFAANATHSTVASTSGVKTLTTAPVPATAVTGHAWSVSDTTATLAGTVDPENAQVSECRFEYGATSAYGHTASCSPAAPGAGHAAVLVTAEVQGLSPGIEYHFRLAAANSCPEVGCGAGTGADATFTTYTEAEALLPQRGFELVSAFETNSSSTTEIESSASGESFAYKNGFLPFTGTEVGASGGSVFRSSRNADGSWSQQYVGLPHPAPETGNGGGQPLFSPVDLSVAFTTYEDLNPEDQNSTSPNNGEDVYLRNEDGSFTWVSRDPEIPIGTPQANPENVEGEVDYVSPGGREVVFGSHRALLEEGTSKTGLYRWREGALSLVSQVPPAGDVLCGGSGPACEPASAYLGSRNFNNGGGLEHRAYENTANAVSNDGSRVIFRSRPKSAAESEEPLYVGLNGEETVDASAYAPGAPTPATACEKTNGKPANPCDVIYWGADESDEQVFFTSSSPLTEGSTAPNTPTGPADLYRWSLPAGGQPAQAKLLDLTPAKGGADVADVLGVSRKGDRVYFAAGAALEGTAATESGECHGGAGQVLEGGGGQVLEGACNVYLAELGGPEDAAVHLTYIATASITIGGDPSQPARNLAISPNGNWFAFRSSDALVPGRQTGGHPQVYVYDAARGELACASCTPDGTAAPVSFGVITQASGRGNQLGSPDSGGTPPNRTEVTPHVRSISSDGALFFQTTTPLVPSDANGVTDVYEWHGGRVGLISSGEGTGAYFADASVDGSTVFFSSTDEYVPGVAAGIRRIYAARVGVPTYESPLGQPPCEAEDCKSLPVSPRQLLAPGSLGLFGPGDLAPPTPSVSAKPAVKSKPAVKRCAKGKKLEQDRCVKAKAKKKRKAMKGARRRKAKMSAAHDRRGPK